MCKREKKESVNWKVKERKGNLPVSVSSPVTAILCVYVCLLQGFPRGSVSSKVSSDWNVATANSQSMCAIYN